MQKFEFTIPENLDKTRLDKALATLCENISRTQIQKAIKNHNLTLNGVIISDLKAIVKENDHLKLNIPNPEPQELIPQDIKLDIIYEDDDLIVVNKAVGMTVHPSPGNMTDTLVNAYITNTVFWRPPGNRRPTQEEIDICRPFVEKHIALINPKLIVMVGSTAATSLLGNHDGISKIRKNNYLYNNRYLTKPIKTTAIFHPAYLLRQPMQKKTTWYDLLGIQKLLTS